MPIRVSAPLNLREIVAASRRLPVRTKGNRWPLNNKIFWGEKQCTHTTGRFGAKLALDILVVGPAPL